LRVAVWQGVSNGEGMKEHSGSAVQSVERAIAILKSFSIETPERGVAELSRQLGLHKSTISRLMSTLERGGLLARSPETKRYRLGIDLISLAAQVVSYMDVREVARPMLRKLAEECQESVNLVVLDAQWADAEPNVKVVNLEQFSPPARQVTNIGRVGRRMYAHCTAAGKVLLASLSADELERVVSVELARFTPHTITDADQLCRELAEVRGRGYAVAQEELEEGLNVVAAPIYDHTRNVIAAASVSGPAYRVRPELFPQLAARLMGVTDQVSRQLGYEG
jgi:DNA-binding IclR family transcriptional regulator